MLMTVHGAHNSAIIVIVLFCGICSGVQINREDAVAKKDQNNYLHLEPLELVDPLKVNSNEVEVLPENDIGLFPTQKQNEDLEKEAIVDKANRIIKQRKTRQANYGYSPVYPQLPSGPPYNPYQPQPNYNSPGQNPYQQQVPQWNPYTQNTSQPGNPPTHNYIPNTGFHNSNQANYNYSQPGYPSPPHNNPNTGFHNPNQASYNYSQRSYPSPPHNNPNTGFHNPNQASYNYSQPSYPSPPHNNPNTGFHNPNQASYNYSQPGYPSPPHNNPNTPFHNPNQARYNHSQPSYPNPPYNYSQRPHNSYTERNPYNSHTNNTYSGNPYGLPNGLYPSYNRSSSYPPHAGSSIPTTAYGSSYTTPLPPYNLRPGQNNNSQPWQPQYNNNYPNYTPPTSGTMHSVITLNSTSPRPSNYPSQSPSFNNYRPYDSPQWPNATNSPYPNFPGARPLPSYNTSHGNYPHNPPSPYYNNNATSFPAQPQGALYSPGSNGQYPSNTNFNPNYPASNTSNSYRPKYYTPSIPNSPPHNNNQGQNNFYFPKNNSMNYDPRRVPAQNFSYH